MAYVDSDNFSASDLCLFIESIEKINRIEQRKRERELQYRAQYLAETLRYLDQQYPASSSSTLSSTDEPEEESILENVEEKEILNNGPLYAVNDILIYDNTYEDHKLGNNSTDLMQNEYCQIDKATDVYSCYEDHYPSWHTQFYDKHCLASTKISQARSSCISSSGIYDQIPAGENSIPSYEEPLECVQSTKISRAPINESSTIYEKAPFEITQLNGSDSSNSSDESDEMITKKASLKRCLLGLVCKKYRKPLPSNARNWCKSKSWMKLTTV